MDAQQVVRNALSALAYVVALWGTGGVIHDPLIGVLLGLYGLTLLGAGVYWLRRRGASGPAAVRSPRVVGGGLTWVGGAGCALLIAAYAGIPRDVFMNGMLVLAGGMLLFGLLSLTLGRP